MRALLTGELYGPLEMRFVSPEGVYYSREVDARPVEDPARGTLYIGYAKDITDQKNQTQELLEQARQLSESVQQVKFWENDYDRVKRLLSSFQSDGMQTSLDDFGAGSSLLNNMVDIPVNTIKLDKLFLTRCSSNARAPIFCGRSYIWSNGWATTSSARASRPRSRCSSSARWTETARRASGSPRPSRLRSSSGGISAAETKKHSPSGGTVRHTVLPEGECCCLERIIPWSRPGEPHRRSLLPSGGQPAPGRSGAPWRLPASA